MLKTKSPRQSARGPSATVPPRCPKAPAVTSPKLPASTLFIFTADDSRLPAAASVAVVGKNLREALGVLYLLADGIVTETKAALW